MSDVEERKAEALERIADELEFQSAALSEVARAQHLTAVSSNDHVRPEEKAESTPNTRTMLSMIRDQKHERDRTEGDRLMPDGGAREEQIKNWLVINWRQGTTRTRKSKPDPTKLGTHELVTTLTLNVTIPEVDVPELRADVEVPQPRVEASELSDLEVEDSADWMDVADDVVDENPDADPYDEVDRLVVSVLEDAPDRPDVTEVRRYIQNQLREAYRGEEA